MENKYEEQRWKKQPEQRRPSMAVFPAKEYRQKAAATASITASAAAAAAVIPVVHYATSVTTATDMIKTFYRSKRI